ncbi:MAG: DUF2800 domain-containing protein [Nevskiaceae bacterium]|nr:MAG: DUF2800 domain-containing protein [Nevskiaceae bacterium]
MADHAAREHATWSASATARNVHCAGALALTRFSPEKTSIHADMGTAVHQIAEKCLRTGVDADTFIGKIERAKAHDIEIDDELANSAQMYVDYCRALIAGSAFKMSERWIEERLTLADLDPPFDAGGTGDFVFYDAGLLEIVDLKNGMGVVDAKENPQLRTYALGALLAHTGLDVSSVKVTIVQPRAPHAEGRIRSETFTVAELIDWTADLLAAMRRSKQAIDEFDAAGSNSVLLDEWRDKWLRPGCCTFCPVEGTCPALKRDALSVAAVWFDDADQPRLGNSALDTSPEALGRDLDMIPMLEDWIKARRSYAHTLAEQGVTIPGYQLADKIGNRKWIDEAAVMAAMIGVGFTADQLYTKKPISPAQADKLLGAKRKALIEPFVERPMTGTNLVSTLKTTRPPAKTVAERYFET